MTGSTLISRFTVSLGKIGIPIKAPEAGAAGVIGDCGMVLCHVVVKHIALHHVACHVSLPSADQVGCVF